MSNLCKAYFVTSSSHGYGDLIEMHYEKDRYTGYTYCTGKVISDSNFPVAAKEISCYVNGYLVHTGMADFIEKIHTGNRWITNFRSRGFTALLAQNEPVPGMNYNVNLTALGEINTQIPNVTYEPDTDTVNYIYVKEKSTIWDAITAYSMKAYGRQPYVTSQNYVRVSDRSGNSRQYADEEIVSTGSVKDLRTVLSTVYMADADGSYSYSQTNSAATSYQIIRDKYYPLDNQWLAKPTTGLELKLDVSNRRYAYKYFSYIGAKNEELFDTAVLATSSITIAGTIGRIEVDIKNGQIITKLFIFNDGNK